MSKCLVLKRPATCVTTQAPVVQRADKSYPADKSLSSGLSYPLFEQPGPDLHGAFDFLKQFSSLHDKSEANADLG